MAEFLILGAGMVGLSAALALQSRGHEVRMIDRRGPGEETSHGNAGVIQSEAAEPYAIPRDPATLLRYALGRSNDVVWHARDLPRMAPDLWRYFRASAPARHAKASRIYSQLIARVIDDHGALIAASGSEALIRRTGLGELYRDARSLDQAADRAQALRDRYGIPSEVLTGPNVTRAEPALRSTVAGLLLWTGPWSCSDPGALTKAYARLFQMRGGRMLRGDAATLRQGGAGWQVTTADGPETGSDAVVALGPWSPDLLARLGYRVPMVWKRGYHGHFQMADTLARPYLDAANGVVMSSMTRGLRITTGADLVRRDGPETLRQLARGQRAVAELFALGAAVPDSQWHGHRPCLPDMLPMVGPAPRHKGLWFDFGHGHQGFTLGPTTGALLADMVAGRGEAFADTLRPTHRKI